MQNLRGRVDVDGSPWHAGMNRIAASAKPYADKIGGSFSGALKSRLGAAFGAGAVLFGFERILRSGVQYAKTLRDISEQTDTTIVETQQIDQAARNAGLSFEKYAQALSYIGDKRKQAMGGEKESLRIFKEYGVLMEDITNPALRNVDIFRKMGEAMQGMKLTPQQRADLRLLMGESGDKILGGMPNFNGSVQLSERDIQAAAQVEQWSKNAGARFKGWSARAISAALISGPPGLYTHPTASPDEIESNLVGPTPDGSTLPEWLEAQRRTRVFSGGKEIFDFRAEEEHARSLNALYAKGLEIQFQKSSVLEKEREINRKLKAIEIERAELGEAMTDSERKKFELQEYALNLEKENLEKSIPRPWTAGTGSTRERMGAFSSSASMSFNVVLMGVQRDQLAELRSLNRNIQNLRGGGGPGFRA